MNYGSSYGIHKSQQTYLFQEDALFSKTVCFELMNAINLSDILLLTTVFNIQLFSTLSHKFLVVAHTFPTGKFTYKFDSRMPPS